MNHVLCSLRYLPSRDGAADLEFLAWTRPYDPRTFSMSLPDDLVHQLFAPGRHLAADAQVEGADCAGAAWKKGRRLPMTPSCDDRMLCTRRDREPVRIHVETRWGACTALLGETEEIHYEPPGSTPGSARPAPRPCPAPGEPVP